MHVLSACGPKQFKELRARNELAILAACSTLHSNCRVHDVLCAPTIQAAMDLRHHMIERIHAGSGLQSASMSTPHHRTTAAPWSSPWNLPLFVMQTLDIRHSKTTDQWWSISWISRKHMSRLVKGPMWTSAIGLLYQSHPITIYKWCLTNPQKGPLCRALCRAHSSSFSDHSGPELHCW